MLRKTMLMLILIGMQWQGLAQNLVPNPDFEMYENCPHDIGQGFLQCTPWEAGTGGTPDYFNACDITPGFVGVPVNVFGHQEAHSGNGYGGLYVKSQTGTYYEYLQTQLITPLVAGITYHVSFYVNLGDKFCPARHIGALFSHLPPVVNGADRIDEVPQVDYIFTEYLSDQAKWTKVSGCFTAQGGEFYITIGNFHDDASTPLEEGCMLNAQAYYHIDDVVVEEGSHPGVLPLDLGSAISGCDTAIIQPNIDSVGYFWEGGSSENSLAVTTSGTYTLTISDGCNVGVDSVDVIILGNSNPVEIGFDTIPICHGDTAEVTLDPMWNYQWSTGQTTPGVFFTQAGLYTVTMNDGCDLSSDTFLLQVVNPPPMISLGPDTVLCVGDELHLQFDPLWGDYVWQDGSMSNAYQVSQSGSYAVTVSNGCGISSAMLVVQEADVPSIDLGAPVVTICADSILILNLDTIHGLFNWQDGSIGSSYEITNSGIYSVTVSNQCGNDIDSIQVIEIVPPTVELGADLTLCPAQLPYTLSAISSPDVIHFEWQDASTNSSFLIPVAGVYSVMASNTCFAVADTIKIAIDNILPNVILPADQILCTGDSLLLLNLGATGIFEWSDHSSDTSLLVTQPGNYALTVTTLCGSGSDSIVIGGMLSPPIPDLGSDIGLCTGDVLILDPGILDVQYVWQDLSQADTFLVISSGTYSVTLSNICGSNSDTIVVSDESDPPQIDLGQDIISCVGEDVILKVNTQGLAILWQDGSTNDSIEVTDAGIYSVLVSNACGSDMDSVQVTFFTSPDVFSLGPDTILCPGENLILHAPPNADSIIWQDESHGVIFVAHEAQTYTLQILNSCGSSSDEIQISIDNKLPVLDLDSIIIICPGDVISLDASQLFPANYSWNSGSTQPQIQITQPGPYAVTVTTPCFIAVENGLTMISDTCFVENSFFIPNVFSPNGDGINDEWTIFPGQNLIVFSIEAQIFDRWGNMVFETKSFPVSWDGSSSPHTNGKPMNPGVYVYRIALTFLEGNTMSSKLLTGDLTLIR